MDAGDIRLGDTIDVGFTTINASGVPTTLAGSPAVAAYPGNSTTEITAGITLSVDFDSRTGLNNVRIVASGGNGYATATNYKLVLTAGTVDGTSVVGYVVGHFSIENRSALRPTTADRTLDVTATGAAGIDWGNVENQSSNVNLDGTIVASTTQIGTNGISSSTLHASASEEIATTVWANATRTLTAIDEDVTTIDLDSTAIGSVGSIATGGIAAASFAVGAIDAAALAADAGTEIATAILDLAAGVETGLTLRQALRLLTAASAGKLSGAATTTIVIRNAVADSKDRITATVTADGNRTAVTYDLT